MNRIDYLEYIDDTILIEAIYQEEFGSTSFHKNAGLFDQLNLGSLSDSIKDFIKSNVKEDAPGGYVGSFLSMMVPAILFRVNPLLGGLATVASAVGFDMQTVIGKILDLVKGKLQKGEVMTESDVNQIGKEVIASEAGVEATAENMLDPLKKYAYYYPWKYKSTSGLLDNLPKTPWLTGSGNGILSKIFGSLFSIPGGKSKIIWVIGGFIVWTIKTLLIGAGLLAGGQFVYKLIKGDKKEESSQETKQDNQEQKSENTKSEEKPESQEPQEVKKIKEDKEIVEKIKDVSKSTEMWIVPIIGTIEGTLMAWTMDLYPEFNNINMLKNKLINSHSFREVVNLLKDPNKMSNKYLIMPSRFTSRKDVVDLFIKDLK